MAHGIHGKGDGRWEEKENDYDERGTIERGGVAHGIHGKGGEIFLPRNKKTRKAEGGVLPTEHTEYTEKSKQGKGRSERLLTADRR